VEPGTLLRRFAADSVVGQAVCGHARHAINFDSADVSALHRTGLGGTSFRCLPGTFTAASPAGEYTVEALHQYSDWRWEPPWNTSVGGFGVSLGQMMSPLNAALGQNTKLFVHGHPPLLLEEQAPPCTTDFRGVFGAEGHFRPSFCTLHRPSPAQALSCLERIGGAVHFISNSHTRRTLKVLTNASWCTNRREAIECVCEDAAEPFSEMPWPNVHYHYWEGLKSQLNAWSIPPEAKVIFFAGLEAWDHAGTDVGEYERLLHEFVALVRQRLHAGVQALVFKTAPYFCCSTEADNEFGRRRFTAKRAAVMNAFYRTVIQDAFPDAIWWDTRAMTEALPLEQTRARVHRCGSNHIDSELCEEDAALLRAVICAAAERRPGTSSAAALA